MLRYFALSAAIVLAVVVGIAGWVYRDALRIKIASVYAPVPPKPQSSNAPGAGSAKGLRGDAPWALSALPECLMQTSESTGPLAYVVGHLPAGVEPVTPPATLAYADCTIFLTDREAYVRRGNDRFRIPPRVRLFRGPGVLALLREDASGNELRVYQPTEAKGRP